MTLEQYRDRLASLITDVSRIAVKSILVPASNELLAKIKNRISVDGKGSTEQKIGNYSTSSAYYNKEKFDRKSSFNARGKNSRGNFANGNQRKTMYFQDGYKGLRNAQGKPTNTVVLTYTGSTMVAYQQSATDSEVLQGMTTQLASDIRKGHEERRGMDIYKASQSELQEYNTEVAKLFTQANINVLKGVSG